MEKDRKFNATGIMSDIAEATNEEGTERVVLRQMWLDADIPFEFNPCYWVLSHYIMDWDEDCYENIFNTPGQAIDAFEREIGRYVRDWAHNKPDNLVKHYTKIELTREYKELRFDRDATRGREG